MTVPNVTALENAQGAYHATAKRSKDERIQAREAWNELCLRETEKVATLEEAVAAFKAAPWGTRSKFRVLEKWAECCATFEDLAHAYNKSCRRFEYDNPVLDKWDALSQIEVHTATTTEEIASAFWASPPKGEAKAKAFVKWMGFCRTLKSLRPLREIAEGSCGYEFGLLKGLYERRYREVHLAELGREFVPMSIL